MAVRPVAVDRRAERLEVVEGGRVAELSVSPAADLGNGHKPHAEHGEQSGEEAQRPIREATVVAKKRVATKPTRASKERRLVGKTQRGQTKRGRSRDWSSD